MRIPLRCVRNALSMDGTLSQRELSQRTLFFALTSVASAALTLSLLMVWDEIFHAPYELVSFLLVLAASLGGVVVVLCKWRVTNTVIMTIAGIYVSTVALMDLHERSFGHTFWPTFVLVIDFLLVMQVPQQYTFGIVSFCVLWLVVMAAEERYRFGILDLPGLSSQGGENGRREFFQKMVECTDLPCPYEGSFTALIHALRVFLIDFVATRQFSRGMQKEQTSMEKTIDVVQEIASLLGGYEVERVSELLAVHEGELPQKIAEALAILEQNLRVYKAYLPPTCLPLDKEVDVPSATVSLRHSIEDMVSSEASLESKAPFSTAPISLSPVRATLLAINVKNSIAWVEEDCSKFSQVFTAVVMKALSVTNARRGMVDIFVGDRVQCSFNASKQCVLHADAGLLAVTALLQGTDEVAAAVNVGVATGPVFRGDMGCTSMRRFSMVGSLVRAVNGVERAGRSFGAPVLCNRVAFSDGECSHQMRLIPCKVQVAPDGPPEIVAELLVPSYNGPTPAKEWMYQIGRDWEDYNTAVLVYLRGEGSAAAVEDEAQIGACALRPVVVEACPSRSTLRFPAQYGGPLKV